MKIILIFFLLSTIVFAKKINIKEVESINKSNSFNENLIIKGGKENIKYNNQGIVHYINGDIKDKDIKDIRIKRDNYNQAMNGLYKDILFNNKNINYDLTKGLPEVVNIMKGYSTTLKFIDDFNKPIKVEGISLGNKILTIKYPKENILEIEPTVSFQQTNLNIRLKGYSNPVIFKIREGYDKVVDINVNIRISKYLNNNNNQNISDLNFKKNILNEIFKYKTLKGKEKINYQVFNLNTKKLVNYFNEYNVNDKLKIFRVGRNGKEYNIILLDKYFQILGKKTSSFSKYSENNTVYFLPLGHQVFTIETIMNDKKDKLSIDRIKDHGLKESYKIILLD